MDSTNTGLWKLLGINSGRYNKVINKIIHLFNSNRFLYVIGDSPHILKKQALLNKVITISNDTMIKYKLTSNKILSKHFFQLIVIQHNCKLLLTPRLKINNLICNNFNKMKVNKAKSVFSHDINSLFELLADEFNKIDFITTAWFVK